jgi:ABC-type ATPase involved in cell division
MSIIVQISELEAVDSEGKKIFTDLHFRLQRGEWACIVGPPGTGKTLLLEFICGERRPQRGQILVDDRNVLRIKPEKLRQLHRRMGLVLHDSILIHRRTLEECVTFKLRALDLPPEEARSKTLDILNLVALGDHTEKYPHELDEVVQQLFRLALALSHDPVLLLLDDPLRNLSSGKEERFLKVLEQVHLRRRLAVLMMAREAPWAERFPVHLHALEGGCLRALHPASVAGPESGSDTSYD